MSEATMIKTNGRFFMALLFVAAMIFVHLFMAKGAIAMTGGAAGEKEKETTAAEA